MKAQVLKAALSSFKTIAVFIITKNVLDEIKALAEDIYEAYMRCMRLSIEQKP